MQHSFSPPALPTALSILMPQLDIIGAHPPSNLQVGMKTVKALMSPLEIPTRLDHTNRTQSNSLPRPTGGIRRSTEPQRRTFQRMLRCGSRILSARRVTTTGKLTPPPHEVEKIIPLPAHEPLTHPPRCRYFSDTALESRRLQRIHGARAQRGWRVCRNPQLSFGIHPQGTRKPRETYTPGADRAACGNRTHDLFITSESLCRLS